jgi:hypothetical protein
MDPISPSENIRGYIAVSMVNVGTHWVSQDSCSISGKERQRTEIIIVLVLMIHMGSPVLSDTFDLEDAFLVGGSIVVDTLKSESMHDNSVKCEMPTVKWLKFHLKALCWR